MASIPRTPRAAALTHMTEAAIYDTKPYDDQKASPSRIANLMCAGSSDPFSLPSAVRFGLSVRFCSDISGTPNSDATLYFHGMDRLALARRATFDRHARAIDRAACFGPRGHLEERFARGGAMGRIYLARATTRRAALLHPRRQSHQAPGHPAARQPAALCRQANCRGLFR